MTTAHKNEYEKFSDVLKKSLSVSHRDIQEKLKEEKKEKKQKRASSDREADASH